MRSSFLYCVALAFASTVALAGKLNVDHYPSKKSIVQDSPFWTHEHHKIDYPKELKPVVYKKGVDPCEQHDKNRNPNAECGHKIDSEHRECENKEHWALTIEEGPNGNSQNYIDALYEAGNVKALFFVVGHRLLVPEYANVLIKIVEAGHEIGINTWSHKRLSTLTDRQIVAEILWTEKAIKEVTGQYPSKYVRPPFGNMDMRVLRIIEALGYKVVLYNADPEDHEFDEKEDNQHDRREVLETIQSRFHKYIEGSKKKHRGTISLHHSVGKVPTLVAKDVLEYIRGGENAEWRNTFVPMSVCLNEGYAHAHKNEAAHEEVVDRKEIKIVRTKVDHTGTPAQKAGDDETTTELTFAHFKDVKGTNADHTGTSGQKHEGVESKTEFSFAHNKVVEDNDADHTKTLGHKREDDDSTAGFTFAPHTGPKRMTPAHEAVEADEKTESRTEITFIHTRTEEEDKPKDATDAQGHVH